MKCPQTKLHAHTTKESQVIRSKKSQNLSLGQKLSLDRTFLAAQFFFFIGILETETTDINMLL